MLKQGVLRQGLLAIIVGAGAGPVAAEQAPLVEDGYLGELPVVLSVTRLAQSLADTPGAVTIIDRDMIRRSGARQVSELLRFVPGFIVSGWNGANPIAQYHSRLDDYGSRLQVFVDGRSVYSSLFLGDTHRGLETVVLEDIERIEVLRGSNSAAYGANAYLGVINIITRNSADTRGSLVSINAGNDGIADYTLRHGWGADDASFRLTASQRSDNGYAQYRAFPAAYPNAEDGTNLGQLNFRSDFRLASGDDFQFQLGASNHKADDGDSTFGNAPHPTKTQSAFALLRYTHQISANESFSLMASYDDEHYDSLQYEDLRLSGVPFAAALIPHVIAADTGGSSQRKQIEFSLTQQPHDLVRTVWGMTWRQESAKSQALYSDGGTVDQTQLRLFGNLEWRFDPQWLLNAGGLFEHNDLVGTNFAPRLMLNYQFLPEHTFRIGATQATRAPSLFELRGDNPIYHQTGVLLAHDVMASGNAHEETILSREIGYLGDMRSYGLTLDVRIFDEQLKDMLTRRRLPAPNPYGTNDYMNAIDAQFSGWEYQAQWRPQAGTRLMLAQAHTNARSEDQPGLEIASPRNNYSIAWFQDLFDQWEMALMYSHMSTMSFRGNDNRIPAYGVVNARVARKFQIGSTRMEVAVTGQALNGDHYEFISPTPSHPMVPVVQRRAFVTLRTEF